MGPVTVSLIFGASRTEFLFWRKGGGPRPLGVRILPGPLLGNVTFPVWRVHKNKNTQKNNYITQLCNPTATKVKKLLTTLSTWSKNIGNDKMTGQDKGIMRDKMKGCTQKYMPACLGIRLVCYYLDLVMKEWLRGRSGSHSEDFQIGWVWVRVAGLDEEVVKLFPGRWVGTCWYKFSCKPPSFNGKLWFDCHIISGNAAALLQSRTRNRDGPQDAMSHIQASHVGFRIGLVGSLRVIRALTGDKLRGDWEIITTYSNWQTISSNVQSLKFLWTFSLVRDLYVASKLSV